MLERKMRFGVQAAMVVLLTTALVGCPENEPASIHVTSSLLPAAGCLFLPGSIAVQPSGLVDLTHNYHGYVAGFSWRNNLTATQQVTQQTPESGLTEASTVIVQGATIEYEHNLGVELPSGFFQSSASFAKTLADGVAIINILPVQVLDRIKESPLFVGRKPVDNGFVEQCMPNHSWENFPIGGKRGELIVKITLEGYTAAGLKVLSNEFRYSIEVCNGCLINRQGDFCTVFQDGAVSENPGGPCGPGQDGPINMFDLLPLCYQVDSANVDTLVDCGNSPSFPTAQAFLPRCLGSTFPSGTPTAANLLFQMYAAERCEKMFNISFENQVPGGQALTPNP